MSEEKAKTIFVKSNIKDKPDGSHPLACFDRDPRHPNDGEAWVAGPDAVEVFPTAKIITELRAERIVETSEKGVAKSNPSIPGASVDSAVASPNSPDPSEKLNEEANAQKDNKSK